MNIEQSKKTLALVKKYKLGYGDDLGVATKGSESIYAIMFQVLLMLFIVTNNSEVRERPSVAIPVAVIAVAIIVAMSIFYRKVSKIRNLMIDKKAFYLNDIKAKQSSDPS